MTRRFAGASLLILTACAASGQTPAAPPSFEVASIKPAPPQGNMIRVKMGSDAGRLDYNNVALRDVVRVAYRVKDYQVSGPDWLGSARFDITAKFPEGATKEQVPEMLQALLADRFKLQMHREKKDLPVYALVVGKGGPKLQKSDPNDDSFPGGMGGPAPPPPPPGAAVGHNTNVQTTAGGRGGGEGRGGGGRGMMMINMNGRMEAKKVTIGGLAEMLARMLDRPVIDETGIAGDYDFQLEFGPDEMRNMRAGMMVPPVGADAHSSPADAASDPGQSIFTAVQKFGLKLEPRKAPLDIIVIDHVEKTPTEN